VFGALDGPRSGFGAFDGPRSAFGAFDAQRSAFGALQARFDPLGVSELKPLSALAPEAVKPGPAAESADDAEDDIDAQDAVDAELFPIFEEEALELIPRLGAQLRIWVREPDESANASACMRILHTLKGGARLAGAMRLGEMAHRLETRIERILAHPPVSVDDLEALEGRCDNLAHALEALAGRGEAAETNDVAEARVAPSSVVTREPAPFVSLAASSPAAPSVVPQPHAELAPPKPLAGLQRRLARPLKRKRRRLPASRNRRMSIGRASSRPSRCARKRRTAVPRRRRRPSASVRRCSIGSSTWPARSASPGRASKSVSARSRPRSAT
jgi:HPt (histidine-containing phosphotransfer) domain-containing protein